MAVATPVLVVVPHPSAVADSGSDVAATLLVGCWKRHMLSSAALSKLGPVLLVRCMLIDDPSAARVPECEKLDALCCCMYDTGCVLEWPAVLMGCITPLCMRGGDAGEGGLKELVKGECAGVVVAD